MKLNIPNSEIMELKTIILDLNGTITIQGTLIAGVLEKITELKKKGYRIVLFSGDTRGNSKAIADELNIELVVASTGEEKMKAALTMDPETCVAIGNGKIDVSLFRMAKLSVATLQAEGAHIECLKEADIIVPSVLNALDLLLDESSLIATLRS